MPLDQPRRVRGEMRLADAGWSVQEDERRPFALRQRQSGDRGVRELVFRQDEELAGERRVRIVRVRLFGSIRFGPSHVGLLRSAQSVDDAADESGTGGNLHDAVGPADKIPLLDQVAFPEENGAEENNEDAYSIHVGVDLRRMIRWGESICTGFSHRGRESFQ